MTIRHFRIFIAVCDTLSMTHAAKTLYMTQPSISQAISELETHYGLRLFERLGRRLRLTAGGEKLLAYARQMTALDSRIESAMRSFSAIYPLRIGASVTIGETFLIPILKKLQNKNTSQQIISEIHNTTELEDMIEADKLDIALVEGALHTATLTAISFAEDELVLVVSPQYNLIKSAAPLALEHCTDFRFFMREEESGTRNLFEQTLRAHHIPIHIAGVYNNTASIKQAVLSGLGAAVLSRRLVGKELQEHSLMEIPLRGISLHRVFHIIYHKDKYLSPALQEFIDICHAVASGL
ncbi:MAG: LysR family transcriptional regulator [Megasphaera cerevisiae]|jgi:DNA-binding transcriptional LysR family regulator|nr:LysR family transcriptional regulator [Megasphaera cerevisiae]